MGDAKLHHSPRRKCRDTRYPSAPRGTPEPGQEIPVHFMDGNLFAVCRVSGAGMRLKTNQPGKVTCPACLKRMRLHGL